MTQEVQTTLDYRAELNLIEGVWHQEGKVREHTQVEPAFGYECYVTGSMTPIVYDWPWDAAPITGTMTLNSQNWSTEFKMADGGLRIPLAGAYLAEIWTKGGSTSYTLHLSIRTDNKILWSKDQQNNSFETATVVLNLWKYDTVKFWAGLTSTVSGTGAATAEWRLRLRKL